MEGLSTIAKGFFKARSAHGDNHEFLQVEVVIGMCATVDDVHHRNGKLHCTHTTKIAIKGKTHFFSSCAGNCHGDCQNSISTKAALIFCAIKSNHLAIDQGLIGCFHAANQVSDFAIDVFNSLQDALTTVALRILITEFNSFTDTRGGARRHSCAARSTTFQNDFRFDRGVATAIEDLATNYINNSTHFFSSLR